MIAQPMFIKQRGKSLEKFVNWYRAIIVARIIVGWWDGGRIVNQSFNEFAAKVIRWTKQIL